MPGSRPRQPYHITVSNPCSALMSRMSAAQPMLNPTQAPSRVPPMIDITADPVGPTLPEVVVGDGSGTTICLPFTASNMTAIYQRQFIPQIPEHEKALMKREQATSSFLAKLPTVLSAFITTCIRQAPKLAETKSLRRLIIYLARRHAQHNTALTVGRSSSGLHHMLYDIELQYWGFKLCLKADGTYAMVETGKVGEVPSAAPSEDVGS